MVEGYGGRGAGFGEENGMHCGVEMEMGVPVLFIAVSA
jgi:hypothetical protein